MGGLIEWGWTCYLFIHISVHKYEQFIETFDGYRPRFYNYKYYNVRAARKIHCTFQGSVFWARKPIEMLVQKVLNMRGHAAHFVRRTAHLSYSLFYPYLLFML